MNGDFRLLNEISFACVNEKGRGSPTVIADSVQPDTTERIKPFTRPVDCRFNSRNRNNLFLVKHSIDESQAIQEFARLRLLHCQNSSLSFCSEVLCVLGSKNFSPSRIVENPILRLKIFEQKS